MFGRTLFRNLIALATDEATLSDGQVSGKLEIVGLIHCMLPNARIIDVRRNPMDCCFANYFRYYGTAVEPQFQSDGYGALLR